MEKRLVYLLGALLLLGLALGACSQAQECPECPDCPEADCPPADCPEATCPAAEPCPEATCPAAEPCPECPSAVKAPFEALWAGSGHADTEAEAFNHWNEDDPNKVPTSCAKCHSEGGYQDFLGADGTEAGVVDNNAPIGTTVSCVTCHNDATLVKTSVVFPSAVEITGLGDESRCMECHQGRAWGGTVDAAVTEAGLTDMDTPSADLGFTNIHYFAAAATQAGGTANGGYQYEGKAYDARFAHVAGYGTCIGCHDSHSLELKTAECATCHPGVTSKDDLKNVRMMGSLADYDGDGDLTEGISFEIEGLQAILYQAIQAYATDVAGKAIVYDAVSYPYFFADANGNGAVDEGETTYDAFTGRLAKAAYNYQLSIKDPGAFAHGGKYVVELLYDSIEDLNPELVAGLARIDPGHFAGSEEAFRHWDEDGAVSASCARCHSADGLPFQLEHGVQIEQPVSNGLQCATCHNDLTTFTRREITEVTFPSGAKLDLGNPDANLCINCHQGRESTVSVNAKIGDAEPDTVVEGLTFSNIHYFAAGATLFGTDAKGAYEYAGKEYKGRFAHVPGFDTCIACHDVHRLEVKEEACSTCHAGIESPRDIRMDATDWDGDGNTTEGIAAEAETIVEALHAAIQAYATDTVGTGIVYDAANYPYFLTEAGEQYETWTPRLLRAAYNYQYVQKDPGAFAHNGKYLIQVLIDSLEDIGGDITGMTRP